MKATEKCLSWLKRSHESIQSSYAREVCWLLAKSIDVKEQNDESLHPTKLRYILKDGSELARSNQFNPIQKMEDGRICNV